MMYGILIQYDYDGDEGEWMAACEAFVSAIDADPRLKGKFSYRINKSADGVGRVHVGSWDTEETVKHLQSQDFFKAFAAKVETRTLQGEPTHASIRISMDQFPDQRIGVNIGAVNDRQSDQWVDRKGLNGILTIHRSDHAADGIAGRQPNRRVAIQMLQKICFARHP